MGKRHRQRTAEQRREQRRTRRAAGPAGGFDPGGRAGDSPGLRDLVVAAALARAHGHPEFDGLVEALAARGEQAVESVDDLLDIAVAQVWTRGWAPIDVVQFAAHTLTAAHADVAAGAVVRDGRRRQGAGERLHPRWAEQLDALAERTDGAPAPAVGRVVRLRLAIELLVRLGAAPTIPEVIAPPGAEGADLGLSGLDAKMLARVRGLLAKAESTEFPAEAESLTVKAQELIARHAIADALLRDRPRDDAPQVRRVPVPDPYAQPKAVLLSQVAVANRCRVTWSPDLGWSTAFGYPGDLDAVELLFTSLLAQAGTAMERLGSQRDGAGRSRTRSFRRSFLLGFAHQIGDRLRRATSDAVVSADSSSGGALLPVLAAREDRVQAAQDAAFPHQRSSSGSVSNGAGWAAGRAAGQLAQLDLSGGALNGASG